jgi:PEGA domain-containing protein
MALSFAARRRVHAEWEPSAAHACTSVAFATRRGRSADRSEPPRADCAGQAQATYRGNVARSFPDVFQLSSARSAMPTCTRRVTDFRSRGYRGSEAAVGQHPRRVTLTPVLAPAQGGLGMTNCVSARARFAQKRESRAVFTPPISRFRPSWGSRARFLPVLALVCAFSVAGCHSATGSCRSFALYSHDIFVSAKDSGTGALVPNATLTAMRPQGDTAKASIGSDVTQYPADLLVLGGTYTVSVTAPGYAAWSATVSVATNCTQLDVPITALMQKSP